MQHHMTNNAAPAGQHFDLLRIAKLRGLKARTLGERVYAVPSHSRKADGIEWVVTLSASDSPLSSVTCSCPAKGYCTHKAAAVDHYLLHSAPVGDFTDYRKACITDQRELSRRIRSGTLTRNDRIYVAFALKVYRRRQAAAGAPRVTKTTVREGRRTRVIERVGAFVI